MIKNIFLKSLPYIILIGFFISGYLGFVHIQNKIEHLSRENSTLQSQVLAYKSENEVLKTNLEDWVDEQKRLETIIVNLQNATLKASKERDRLDDIFQKHRLETLAKAKPVLIENRFNNGTSRIIRMLECATDPTCDNPDSGTKNNNNPLPPTNKTK